LHLAGIETQSVEARKTVSRPARYLVRSAALVALGAAGFTALIGCGSTYRPVLSAINPVGPSSQPTKYAVAISSPSPTSPGLVTIVDFSGDTVLITANIGVSPQYLILGGGGTTGYTINGDGTLNSFGISTQLLSSQVLQTTPLSGSNPVSIFPQGTNTYVTEPGRNAIGEFQNTGVATAGSATAGSPLALKQEFALLNPIYVVGIANATRVYALGQGDGTIANPPSAVAIDTTSNTPTASIPVGKTPVYGVMTADGKRAFVMNKGDGTVNVINVQTNQLDAFATATPAGSGIIKVGTAPLWADFAPPLAEMVVANAGDGTGNGSLSIISIPLCNASSPTTNVNCDPNNPVDATGFGTVLAQPSVGVNPVMVAALQDGSRAYVANAGNATTSGSVSVVNLTTNLVSATIPLSCHPSYIAATTGTPTGKVYVICSDSKNMTVIRTDNDVIDGTIPLQGTGVSVRVTAP
jgi:YVTN family beta-propeller protein